MSLNYPKLAEIATLLETDSGREQLAWDYLYEAYDSPEIGEIILANVEVADVLQIHKDDFYEKVEKSKETVHANIKAKKDAAMDIISLMPLTNNDHELNQMMLIEKTPEVTPVVTPNAPDLPSYS